MVHRDDWARPTVLSQLLGNSMAANALAAVAIPLIRVIKPELEVVDPWVAGSMQYHLKQSAMAERKVDDPPTTADSGESAGIKARPANQSAERGRGNPKATRPGNAFSMEGTGSGVLGHTACVMTDEKTIGGARRGGAIYQEIFQIIGPGITPRDIAGATWCKETPPAHCMVLCSIARAIRSGNPLPHAPADGWPREDLQLLVNTLWRDWGIQVEIRTLEQAQHPIVASKGCALKASAIIFYEWSCTTGKVRLTGATRQSVGKGMTMRHSRAPEYAGNAANTKPVTAERRLAAIDQAIHCPTEPCEVHIRNALRKLPYPSVTLGLASHPLKGAAISSSTAVMPNLTWLLTSYAHVRLPGTPFTTVRLRRAKSNSSNSTGWPGLRGHQLYVQGSDASEQGENGGDWMIHFSVHACAGSAQTFPESAHKALRRLNFPAPATGVDWGQDAAATSLSAPLRANADTCAHHAPEQRTQDNEARENGAKITYMEKGMWREHLWLFMQQHTARPTLSKTQMIRNQPCQMARDAYPTVN